MKNCIRVLALAAVGLVLFSGIGCDKLKARDQLNKGVTSYKNARYEEAIDHFQQAVNLDPKLLNARLYLGTALANQYMARKQTYQHRRNPKAPESRVSW